MRNIIVASLATLAMTVSAYAGGRGNDYQQTRPVVNQGGQGGKGGTGIGVGVGVSKSRASARSSSRSSSVSSATGGSASSRSSVSNSGNSSVTFKDRAQAPGFGLGGGHQTAPCQSYTELAASFPGGGFGFGTGRTVKFCKLEQQSDWLSRKGYKRASIDIVYCGDRDVKRAMEMNGYKKSCQ